MTSRTIHFDGIARDPDGQFQIGDRVLYLPEGIYCKVVGYIWDQDPGSVQRILAYALSCGIDAPENTIVRDPRTGPRT